MSPDRLHATRDHSAAARRLELLVLIHLAGLIVFVSWAFGGAIGWAHDTVGWWGCAGVLLPLGALLHPKTRHLVSRPTLVWSLPFWILVCFVVASCLNPSFEPHRLDGSVVYLARPHAKFWPSTARPDLAWRELLMYSGCYFSALNISLLVHRRRAIRFLLWVVAGNSFALSVMGTAQNLLHTDLYFGAIKSPNLFWFATFVYHNHWGAFTLLSLSAATALILHQLRRIERAWEFWHTPAFAGLVATFFIGITIPLSGSRSSTFLAAVLLTVVFGHWLLQHVRRQRLQHRPVGLTIAGIAAAVALCLGAIYQLGRQTIDTRVETTINQVQDMRGEGGIGARSALYRDTIRMGRERPWTGWGLESFATVFSNYDSQESYRRKPPTHYEDAHSDWLQSFAEIGLIGTALLLLTGLAPLAAVVRHGTGAALTFPLWTGCLLIALYAWIEFPLANPAVVLVFWTVFFSAVRYSLLTTAKGSR